MEQLKQSHQNLVSDHHGRPVDDLSQDASLAIERTSYVMNEGVRRPKEIPVYNCCATNPQTWQELMVGGIEASKKYPFENVVM